MVYQYRKRQPIQPREEYPDTHKKCMYCQKIMPNDEYCEHLGGMIRAQMAKVNQRKRPRRKVARGDSTGAADSNDSGSGNDTQQRLF